jgi:micrococcal nuclease
MLCRFSGERGFDSCPRVTDADGVVRPADWWSRIARAATRAQVFVREHPRFGIGALAVVVLAAIGLGGSLLNGGTTSGAASPAASAKAPSEPLLAPLASPLPVGRRRGPFPVLRVVDGQTLLVAETAGRTATVRLLGVDAPLLADQGLQSNCLASAATRALTRLVAGRRVSLEIDPSQVSRDRQLGSGSPGDDQMREVAYVYVGGTLVNEALLDGGYVDEYADRPYRLQVRFRGAEEIARLKRLGVWDPGGCNIGGG